MIWCHSGIWNFHKYQVTIRALDSVWIFFCLHEKLTWPWSIFEKKLNLFFRFLPEFYVWTYFEIPINYIFLRYFSKIIACAGWAYVETISSLCWAYTETISLHTESKALSWTNFRACLSSVQMFKVLLHGRPNAWWAITFWLNSKIKFQFNIT